MGSRDDSTCTSPSLPGRQPRCAAFSSKAGTPPRRSTKRSDAAFEELCGWLDFFNGHVHHKLDLGTTPLGCRGVITTDLLTAEDQQTLPCMAIPDSLAITLPLAHSQLAALLEPVGLTGIGRLSPEAQIAVFLAHEKQKGTNSRFHPYISTMPAMPPSGFLMPAEQARAELARYLPQEEVDRGVETLRGAALMYDEEIGEAEDFMDALNLDVPEVRWALGQAVSRAYGNNPMLIPAIDCVNHSNTTAPPITIKNEEGQNLTCVSNFAPDYSTRELCAGEEVFVNYAGSDGFERGAMEMFVDYGFMPPELLEGASVVAGDDEDFDL